MTKELTYLALHLRSQDAAEVMKSSRLPAVQVLINSWHHSEFRKLYRDDDQNPLAVVGVVNRGRESGVPWMLATSEVDRMPATLHRESKRVLRHIRSKYSHLMNVVDADNTVAIEWLDVLGFEFGNPVSFGPYDLPFLPFSWSR